MKETIRMRAPREQTRACASEIFLIRRAHVLRASLERCDLYGDPALAKVEIDPRNRHAANALVRAGLAERFESAGIALYRITPKGDERAVELVAKGGC